MKVNLYDFDNTIYQGDSSVDFFFFCLVRKPQMVVLLPKIFSSYCKYRLNKIDKTAMKEVIFSYLSYFDNIEDLVSHFWVHNRHKIKAFYCAKEHDRDIIISASPTFLLKPIAMELKVKDLIASEVDPQSGHFNLPNCHGGEKVRRLFKKYPDIQVEESFSDSLSDLPILTLAQKAYLVKGQKITTFVQKK